MIKKQIEIEIELTPEDFARLFWEMDANEQAKVFNYLAILDHFQWQMNQVALSNKLKGGRKAMQAIGFAILGGN